MQTTPKRTPATPTTPTGRRPPRMPVSRAREILAELADELRAIRERAKIVAEGLEYADEDLLMPAMCGGWAPYNERFALHSTAVHLVESAIPFALEDFEEGHGTDEQLAREWWEKEIGGGRPPETRDAGELLEHAQDRASVGAYPASLGALGLLLHEVEPGRLAQVLAVLARDAPGCAGAEGDGRRRTHPAR